MMSPSPPWSTAYTSGVPETVMTPLDFWLRNNSRPPRSVIARQSVPGRNVAAHGWLNVASAVKLNPVGVRTAVGARDADVGDAGVRDAGARDAGVREAGAVVRAVADRRAVGGELAVADCFTLDRAVAVPTDTDGVGADTVDEPVASVPTVDSVAAADPVAPSVPADSAAEPFGFDASDPPPQPAIRTAVAATPMTVRTSVDVAAMLPRYRRDPTAPGSVIDAVVGSGWSHPRAHTVSVPRTPPAARRPRSPPGTCGVRLCRGGRSNWRTAGRTRCPARRRAEHAGRAARSARHRTRQPRRQPLRSTAGAR